jgi:phage gpG-like protein
VSNFVTIHVDPESQQRVNNDFKKYGVKAAQALKDAIAAVAFEMETHAKDRLRGNLGSERHIVTARLMTSVHTEMKGDNSFKPIQTSEAGDGSFNIPIGESESLIGTNVEYANNIEYNYDSFIRDAAVKQGAKLPQRIKQFFDKIKV